MNGPLRLLLIADSDSQLHYCQALSRLPEELAVEVTLNVVPRPGTPESLIQHIESRGEVWRLPLDRLLRHPALQTFQAIGVFLTGSQIAGFREAYHKLSKNNQDQPAILFCGFNGVVLEKFEEGISWRLGYDLICLNGPRDQQRLQRLLRHTPFAQQPTAITGLRRQAVSPTGSESPPQPRARRLIFAEQVLMPRRPVDRCHMVCILADLARRSPEWEVIIKPRIRPEERTFHAGIEHISQTIDKSIGVKPVNLKISYEPIATLLQSSAIMATISSTAVFDALDLGCKPVVMADFGWGGGNGTPFFKGSGLLRKLEVCDTLDQLDADLPGPNPEWLAWVGYDAQYTPQNLYITLQALWQQRKPVPNLDLPGYQIAQIVSDSRGLLGPTLNQLRADAEEAILQRQWEQAEELLSHALLQKPEHRNIKRRLKAVRSRNPLIRNVRLALSPRFKLQS